MFQGIDTDTIDRLCAQQNALNKPQTMYRVGTVVELRHAGKLIAYASANRGVYLPDGTDIITRFSEALKEWDQIQQFLDNTDCDPPAYPECGEELTDAMWNDEETDEPIWFYICEDCEINYDKDLNPLT